MVLKERSIFGIALLVALAINPVSLTSANSGNNLVQLDLKRASNNSVNVTLFTSNNYDENVFVRKKSDNKYVILVPKVQSSGYSSANLNGLHDLVSDVNVKTVNDTNGGYTKVTIITTKPLNIKTSTQKSAAVTEDQKEYKTLIAQANAIKNNIGKQPQTAPKTEVTVNKAKTVQQQPKKAQNIEKIAANVPVNIKPVANKQVKKVDDSRNIKQASYTKSQAPDIKLDEVNPNKDRITRREQLAQMIEEVKQEKAAEKAPETGLKQDSTNVSNNTNTLTADAVKDIKEMPKVSKPTFLHIAKSIIKKTAKALGYTVLALLGLIIISNILRAIFGSSKSNGQSFSRLSTDAPISNTLKYNNITNNSELSWQEKYQRYLDESAKPVSRGKNKGNYTFIKKPAEPVSNPIDKKRKDLEQMVSEVSKVKLNDIYNIEPEIVEVQSEDDAISKAIRFKAFDNNRNSLKLSHRDRIKSRFKKYEKEIPLHEQKNIELGDSILHANPRRLKDANLNVSDVTKEHKIKFKPSEYIMSSVDEFFSIIDKEQATKEEAKKLLNPTINPVITNNIQTPSNNIKAPELENKTVTKSQTNPITQLRNETKNSYLNGLIVKSGYNIDNNKGFYVVNLDGKSALIGKVNDEIFVLKKFDGNVTNPIQVRHDNANVYMVKAGDFKSLVEVNNDKMGVLIEL